MFAILPTRVHGVMDYLMGLVLVAMPLVFGFGAGPQTWLPVLLGAGVIVYSLLTAYELGVVPLIGMPAHLVMDAAGGLLLAASPWLFGFAGTVWMPYVILGVAELGTAVITRPRPAQVSRAARGLGASA